MYSSFFYRIPGQLCDKKNEMLVVWSIESFLIHSLFIAPYQSFFIHHAFLAPTLRPFYARVKGFRFVHNTAIK
jgi:hypothetical protein